MWSLKREWQDIKFVTIHHSAVERPYSNLPLEATTFDRWHSQKTWAADYKTGGEKGFRYISYHYIVNQKGEHLHVQNLEYKRAHATDSARGELSHNEWGIAICMSGNFQTQKPTEAQVKKVATLIYLLEQPERLGKSLIVRGHNETALKPTACPGKNLGNHKRGVIRDIIDMVNKWHEEGYPEEVDYKMLYEETKEELDKYKQEEAIQKAEVEKLLTMFRS